MHAWVRGASEFGLGTHPASRRRRLVFVFLEVLEPVALRRKKVKLRARPSRVCIPLADTSSATVSEVGWWRGQGWEGACITPLRTLSRMRPPALLIIMASSPNKLAVCGPSLDAPAVRCSRKMFYLEATGTHGRTGQGRVLHSTASGWPFSSGGRARVTVSCVLEAVARTDRWVPAS